MKKASRVLVILAMLLCLGVVMMGAKKCGEDDKLVVTQVALATVQIGAEWR
jgi:hypothetical protein